MTRRLDQGTGRLALHAILLASSLSGCAGVDMLMLTGETFPPKASVGNVQVLEQEPTRPHIQIAELSVDSLWLSITSKRRKILEKAAALGADAVVFSEPEAPPLTQGHQIVGQSRRPSRSLAKDGDTVMADDRSTTVHDAILQGDVRVVFTRGGGGGHGGGGHWGGMRGRSGPSAARPWGRFYAPHYGPRYWGYGYYGPGGWGYAPYWRGYDPFWGRYPRYMRRTNPGLGPTFMNTVTIGTAIRYSDSP